MFQQKGLSNDDISAKSNFIYINPDDFLRLGATVWQLPPLLMGSIDFLIK